MTSAWLRSDYELSNDTPYFIVMDDLCSVFGK